MPRSLQDYYHDLHRLAELSGEEVRTGAYIAEALAELGFEPRTNVGGHGVVAVIDSGRPGPVVLFRADMDALPYADGKGGVKAVHACGHDGHCSMLLAAAPRLKETVKRGVLKLVFQPGEENLTGALAMIRDNVLENVDIAVGAHIRPIQDLPAGFLTAAVNHVACATVKVRFVGKAAHASRPHQGVNAIDMAAAYIWQVNAIRLDPNASHSVKATRMTAEPGATNNICAWTEIIFDLRALTNPILTDMIETMKRMAQSTALGFAGSAEFAQIDYCPASDYDAELVLTVAECIKETASADKLHEPVGGGGEDFHFYKVEKPSVRTAYFGVGVGAEPGLHKEDMHFDPKFLAAGTEVWVRLAEKLLG